MIFLYKTTLIRPTSCLPVVLAILILTGCATVGPDYVPPNKSVSKDWHTQLKGGLATGEMDPQALAAWWTTLNDPELSSLIDRAVLGNLDLRKALARVRAAGAVPWRRRERICKQLRRTCATSSSPCLQKWR